MSKRKQKELVKTNIWLTKQELDEAMEYKEVKRLTARLKRLNRIFEKLK